MTNPRGGAAQERYAPAVSLAERPRRCRSRSSGRSWISRSESQPRPWRETNPQASGRSGWRSGPSALAASPWAPGEEDRGGDRVRILSPPRERALFNPSSPVTHFRHGDFGLDEPLALEDVSRDAPRGGETRTGGSPQPRRTGRGKGKGKGKGKLGQHAGGGKGKKKRGSPGPQRGSAAWFYQLRQKSKVPRTE